ncbi:type II toxin-antitoxin system RelE/ParE family toxin [Atlantibacter hermannii]|uniref:type II toxin-antitoxin system RelE/ParE family toxin n=1 Tax=Atlantibacter hermannii TaxID=565 RepID=UPI0028A72D29|nr:type II toxin-antitoxin system RelE/ParE family toxin [Atlantibacter hermannii]
MPQVIVAASAKRDLQRLHDFLKNKNAHAAKKAAEILIRGIQHLQNVPHIGRPVGDLAPEFHELIVEFGNSGYVMLYRYDEREDRIIILKIKHQKEIDYYRPGRLTDER